MKTIKVILEDWEYNIAIIKKGEKTWKEIVMHMKKKELNKIKEARK